MVTKFTCGFLPGLGEDGGARAGKPLLLPYISTKISNRCSLGFNSPATHRKAQEQLPEQTGEELAGLHGPPLTHLRQFLRAGSGLWAKNNP